MKNKLLEVQDLRIVFPKKKKLHTVLEGVSFELMEGEILGIVGESGSGKTMTALSVIDLLSKEARIQEGRIFFGGNDILQMQEQERRKLKGKEISMIFQEPMTSLNPVLKIGDQIEEMIRLHLNLDKKNWRRKVLESLEQVGLSNFDEVYEKYPHQLSGGMRQRVMIAMAMICEPKLLIADEPTTALDVTVQAQILHLIQKLNQEHGTAVIFISHDLGVIKHICNRALVMNEGKIVESGTMEQLFGDPKEEYTKKLLEAVPTKDNKLRPTNSNLSPEVILEVKQVNAFYQEKQKSILAAKERRQILDQVSLSLHKGEILGIVGESGCGKSTLAKTIVGLTDDYTGEIKTNGLRPQMVFQDPYGSLNPVKKVGWILEEPLKIQGGYTKLEREEKVLALLKQVGLQEKHAGRYVSELSGGQRQRVGIACAIICNAKVVILDEPVSSLDVTVQMQILKLLQKLRKEYDLSYLFISHDLNVIYQMCDRVCVMYQGKIVETGDVEQLFQHPQHDYTKSLLESIPTW